MRAGLMINVKTKTQWNDIILKKVDYLIPKINQSLQDSWKDQIVVKLKLVQPASIFDVNSNTT